MIQQDLIENRPLELERFRFPRKSPHAKGQLEHLRAIAEMKLGAVFFDLARSFERRQDTHLLENRAIVRQQRFADVKAGKVFLFQDEDPPARARQESAGGASAGATSNNQGVVSLRHREQ